jgi:hypothetical protein
LRRVNGAIELPRDCVASFRKDSAFRACATARQTRRDTPHRAKPLVFQRQSATSYCQATGNKESARVISAFWLARRSLAISSTLNPGNGSSLPGRDIKDPTAK